MYLPHEEEEEVERKKSERKEVLLSLCPFFNNLRNSTNRILIRGERRLLLLVFIPRNTHSMHDSTRSSSRYNFLLVLLLLLFCYKDKEDEEYGNGVITRKANKEKGNLGNARFASTLLEIIFSLPSPRQSSCAAAALFLLPGWCGGGAHYKTRVPTPC